MKTNGHLGVTGKSSVHFGKALAFAGLLIAANAHAEKPETQNSSEATKPRPSSDHAVPASSRVRELVFTSTDRRAELQGRYPSGWRVVCTGSCRTQAFVGARYRVSGRGVPTSGEVAMPDGSNAFAIHARAGSTNQQVAGEVMIGVGSASLLALLPLYVVAACSGDCSGASQAERDSGRVASAVFLPVLIAGVATTATGIALLASGGTKLDMGGLARAPRLRLGRVLELTPAGFVF